jgi:hypothetical protein
MTEPVIEETETEEFTEALSDEALDREYEAGKFPGFCWHFSK